MAILGEKRTELIITRVFDASREQVWNAWTEPERLKQWWGPRSFTAPYSSIDPRPGGKYLNCMRGPDGKDYWSTGTFREVIPPEQLAMTDSFADEQGNIVPATRYGMSAEFPLELQISVTFEEISGGRTRMILRHEGFPQGEASEQAQAGWNESFDKLAEYLQPKEK